MENRININNYEAFLLDYMEGNLSSQDISLLKEFPIFTYFFKLPTGLVMAAANLQTNRSPEKSRSRIEQ